MTIGKYMYFKKWSYIFTKQNVLARLVLSESSWKIINNKLHWQIHSKDHTTKLREEFTLNQLRIFLESVLILKEIMFNHGSSCSCKWFKKSSGCTYKRKIYCSKLSDTVDYLVEEILLEPNWKNITKSIYLVSKYLNFQ